MTTITVILGAWDHCVDERDLTVDQWKDLIYKEVVDYEISKGKKFLFQSNLILPLPLCLIDILEKNSICLTIL